MNTIINKVHHAQCKKCLKWFPISRQLQDLIDEGYVHPLEVNLCDQCAEEEQENAIYEAELNYELSNI